MLCPTALRRHAWLQLPAARLHGSPAAADAQPPPPPADAGGAAAAQAAQRRRSAGGGVPAAADVPQPVSTKVVLYRGRGMPLLRALVRLKVFQLAGVAALAIPINSVWATGGMAGTQALLASALVGGAGFAASTLWYGSRRYVGELALLPGQPGQPPRVRLSVLDFWGNREDNDVALQALVPPLQHLTDPARRQAAFNELLLPVDVERDRQYFLSPRFGVVDQPAMLQALLTGQLEGQQLRAD